MRTAYAFLVSVCLVFALQTNAAAGIGVSDSELDVQTVKLWDANSGQLLSALTSHRSTVNAVAFSPDGKLLASASSDKTVKLWDAVGNKEAATLAGHESVVTAVVFSPDGKLLASAGGDKTIRLWDVSERKLIGVLNGHSDAINALA
ncbi:MAG: hypothetical protein M3362_02210, partial [Acidobacteriota bacterium]|nr:hypothetical protein [Acidobacteriota bacterium]